MTSGSSRVPAHGRLHFASDAPTRVSPASLRCQAKNPEGAEQAREAIAAIKTSEVFSNGITFSPFEEVAPEFQRVEGQVSKITDPGLTLGVSFARVLYTKEVESAINDQINVELSISYVYAAMASYFARDNVGLRGFAGFFANESAEERSHANLLLTHQIKRGGRVKLGAISSPESEFFHPDKGDVLYATELALSLEKLNFQKLRALRRIAEDQKDDETTKFLDDFLLEPQALDVEETALFVSKLKRIGLGYGVWHMDKDLMEKYPNAINSILSGAA